MVNKCFRVQHEKAQEKLRRQQKIEEIRQKEVERLRQKEIELEKIRQEEEELEKIRQEKELEKLRQEEEELERIRKEEEELEKIRLEEEEAEMERIRLEEIEREKIRQQEKLKRQLEKEEKRQKQLEKEKRRTEEIEKERIKQQEKEEKEAKIKSHKSSAIKVPKLSPYEGSSKAESKTSDGEDNLEIKSPRKTKVENYTDKLSPDKFCKSSRNSSRKKEKSNIIHPDSLEFDPVSNVGNFVEVSNETVPVIKREVPCPDEDLDCIDRNNSVDYLSDSNKPDAYSSNKRRKRSSKSKPRKSSADHRINIDDDLESSEYDMNDTIRDVNSAIRSRLEESESERLKSLDLKYSDSYTDDVKYCPNIGNEEIVSQSSPPSPHCEDDLVDNLEFDTDNDVSFSKVKSKKVKSKPPVPDEIKTPDEAEPPKKRKRGRPCKKKPEEIVKSHDKEEEAPVKIKPSEVAPKAQVYR